MANASTIAGVVTTDRSGPRDITMDDADQSGPRGWVSRLARRDFGVIINGYLWKAGMPLFATATQRSAYLEWVSAWVWLKTRPERAKSMTRSR